MEDEWREVVRYVWLVALLGGFFLYQYLDGFVGFLCTIGNEWLTTVEVGGILIVYLVNNKEAE